MSTIVESGSSSSPAVPVVGSPAVPPSAAVAARKKSFPEALYDLVQYCHGNHKDKLSWADDDDGFVVKDRRYFEFHILPLFFRHGRFGSLERQLANYGFRRDGRGIGAYRHEEGLFRRNQPDNIKNITLRKNKRPREDGNAYEETPEPLTNPAVPRGSSAEGPAAAMMMLAQASAAGPVPAAVANQVATVPPTAQVVVAAANPLAASVPAAGNPPPIVSMENSIRAVPPAAPPAIRTPPPPQVNHPPSASLMARTNVMNSGPRTVGSDSIAAVAPGSSMTPIGVAKIASSDVSLAYTSELPSARKLARFSNAVLSPTVPNLPRQVVQRLDVLHAAVKNLLEHSPTVPVDSFTSSRNNSFTTFVTGTAGIGKSITASMVVRSTEVRRFFYDGLSWITPGTKKIESAKQLVKCYKMIIRQIQLTDSNCKPPVFEIEEQKEDDDDYDDEEFTRSQMEAARSLMSTFMVHRRSLVVLDDLYHLEDLQWFNFGYSDELKSPYRVLVTTRMNPVGFIGLAETPPIVEINEMDEKEAIELLANESGRYSVNSIPQEFDYAREIVRKCNYIPLVVKVAGQMVSAEQPNSLSLSVLAREMDHFVKLASSQAQTADMDIIKVFDMSFEALGGPEARDAKMSVKAFFKRLALSYTSSENKTPWISFQVVQRLVQGMDDEHKLEIDDYMRAMSTAPWGDKTVVLLGVLTTLGLVDMRKIQDAQDGAPDFEYRVRDEILLQVAANMTVYMNVLKQPQPC